MSRLLEPMIVLMADDDPDDRLMAQEAFEEGKLATARRGTIQMKWMRK